MYETLSAISRDRDLFSALEHLHTAGTPYQVADAYHHLIVDAYWKHKDLPMIVAAAQSGIAFCLAHAHATTDPALAASLRATAKGLAYNLGSFTWPGWDEPGIAPSPADTALGLHAARFNLRMAHELQKPADKIRAANWLLGAQLLAAEETEQALTAFREAVPPDESDADRTLFRGYEILSRVLLGEDRAESEWQSHIQGLRSRSDDHAKSDLEQLTTARRVFDRSFSAS